MAVNFKDKDDKFIYPVICKKTDKFKDIEDKVYDKYPQYKNDKNVFSINGKKINKEKSIEENDIDNGHIILLEFNT